MRLLIVSAVLTVALATGARAGPEAPPHSTLSRAAFSQLATAYRSALETGHEPRTDQRDDAGAPLYVNRLIAEASPYLRQHAHNPVDWRPWGEAALAEARALGRPIFLSVGYAACHWCHVMEVESFDDPEVAVRLNRDFVPIKVDRETHPAVDEAYIRATELITGAAGWPNTLWLTPDGAPIFARTYMPKADLLAASHAISTAWKEDQAGLRAYGAQVAAAIKAEATRDQTLAIALGAEARSTAFQALLDRHNPLTGGFSETAQFPLAPSLRFLLDHWRRTGEAEALEAVQLTLDYMIAGGLHDHVGGGFHRYTVDPDWDLPHFEKMLYTQSQMARVLVEAWEITGRAAYRRAAERTLDYVLRDMMSADGGFYASEDADSALEPNGERVEGAFYAWTHDAVVKALDDDPTGVAAAFALDAAPLIEAGATLRSDADEIDALAGFDMELNRLRALREERPRPFRDEKIIAGWNGLMIEAFAAASVAFERPDYRVAAERSAALLWGTLWRPAAATGETGTLGRFLIDGAAADAPGALTDYAWLALGAIALADAGAGDEWSKRAVLLTDAALARFRTDGGRLALDAEPTPLGRTLESDDSILPTGESSLIEALALLALRQQGFMAEDDARAALSAAAPAIVRLPDGRVTALQAAAIVDEGESGHRRALADGMVQVNARHEGGRFTVRLSIAPGWHINAHRPHDDMLIPTVLEGVVVGDVVYPAPHDVDLGFSDMPLSVIEGAAEISAEIKSDVSAASGDQSQAPVDIALTLQACSTEICLEPRRAVFRFSPAGSP